MDPLTVTTTVARPREEVFEYLADIANHAEFCDHFLSDWHLTRLDSYGKGAGARFRVEAPLNRFSWADMTFVEVEPPYRIVQHGRGGKFNRVRQRGEWRLTPGAPGTTRVELTLETAPRLPSDRVMEILGGRGWFKRKLSRALARLRAILEEDRERGVRPTVGGR